MLLELEQINPRYIILLGNKVASNFFPAIIDSTELFCDTHTTMFDKFYTTFVMPSPKELFLDRDKYHTDTVNCLDYISGVIDKNEK